MKGVVAVIRRWHWGKIVILWSWGGLFVALLLTEFLTTPPRQEPRVSLATFLGSFAILVTLTVITWIWLGGKNTAGED